MYRIELIILRVHVLEFSLRRLMRGTCLEPVLERCPLWWVIGHSHHLRPNNPKRVYGWKHQLACLCVGNGETLTSLVQHSDSLTEPIRLQTIAMSTSPKPVKKVPIHLQSAQNRVYIKNGKLIIRPRGEINRVKTLIPLQARSSTMTSPSKRTCTSKMELSS